MTSDYRGYKAVNYVRDVSVYWTEDTLFLTHCKKGVVVRVEDLGRVQRDSWAKKIDQVRTGLVTQYIAKRAPWSFDDAIDALNQSGYAAQLEPVVDDGCLCELEN